MWGFVRCPKSSAKRLNGQTSRSPKMQSTPCCTRCSSVLAWRALKFLETAVSLSRSIRSTAIWRRRSSRSWPKRSRTRSIEPVPAQCQKIYGNSIGICIWYYLMMYKVFLGSLMFPSTGSFHPLVRFFLRAPSSKHAETSSCVTVQPRRERIPMMNVSKHLWISPQAGHSKCPSLASPQLMELQPQVSPNLKHARHRPPLEVIYFWYSSSMGRKILS